MTASDVFHLGLMAELNDAANEDDAPEVAFFHRVIERGGGPALDAGCGPGRLLRRCLPAGLDVEGSDISADILEICRRRCAEAGLAPVLHRQSSAALDLPRRFRTIVMCGSFGLNGTRADDVATLARIHHHLMPGGTVTFDVEPDWGDPDVWRLFAEPERLQTGWRARGSMPTRHGTEIATEVRDVEVDRTEMSFTRDVRCHLVRDGAIERTEVHRLVVRAYNPHEVVSMLHEAGFAGAAFTEEPLWDGRPSHVFSAMRP